MVLGMDSQDVEIEDHTVEDSSDSPQTENPRFDPPSVMAILDKCARSGGHFKSQQLNEPDLSLAEKREIARELLDRNPALFLSRFAKYLDAEDAGYFRQFDDEYEVRFHLNEIESRSRKKKNVDVRNRRFEALKRMVRNGDEYFFESEMKKRNPLLYEQLVGQYMTEEEKAEAEKIDRTDMRFTTILMEHIERDQTRILQLQQQMEEEEIEEHDDDEEEDSDNEEVIGGISERERSIFKEEFVSSMYRSFLDGKDDYDYSSIDNNAEYDNLDIRQQDEEESYFDSEEPQTSFEKGENMGDVLSDDPY